MDGTLPRIAPFENTYVVGGYYYTPELDGGWFFGPRVFIILKSSYQDLSNEGSKIVLSSLELVF